LWSAYGSRWSDISLEDFTFSYNYPGYNEPECSIADQSIPIANLTIPDMPESVLLGLAVSTGIAPPFCAFTEARFSEIQLDLN
jgi:hypothetical protein